ncbi:AsmA-like C-terminal region-containing protein [Paraflavitalea pollutisoli]|uniref:AsmA family protein n=1 Tax=Paraflavitalea pollutisoli TaxID=3034143 RepID=UPI0023EDB956|nr:AsmA-like C-terminal region-containing protein [Paraflavitalea sp. H1-2-19X]
MTRKTRKRLIRLLLLFPIALIVLVLIAVAILYNQQQRLVRMALEQLNKELPGELVIGSSDIAAFENFPYISIRLNDVQLYTSKRKTTPAAYEAERMLVGFTLTDILKQQYRAKIIVLKNGHADIVQDTVGRINVVEALTMKADTSTVDTTSAPPLDLDLKKVVLRNMRVSYLDQASQQHIVARIDRIQSAIKADSVLLKAHLSGKAVLDYTRPGDTTLFRNKHLETEIDATYNKLTQVLDLPVAKLKLEAAQFNIAGTIDRLNGNMIDLKITGDRPDFNQLFSFDPDGIKKDLKHFNYDGRLSFDGTVKGKLQAGQLPFIELNFSCADAWVHNTEADKKLDSLAFKGYFTNGAGHNLKTAELRLLNVHARPGTGIFQANFVLRDFTDPHILMQVDSDLELEFIGKFLGIKDLQRITGQVRLKMDFKELVDMSEPEQSIGKLTKGIQSELSVRDLTFRIPNYPHHVEDLNLHASMKNGFVTLDSLAFHIANSDFFAKGSLSDLPALFHHQDKPVQLTFSAHSNKMVMKELLAFDTAKSNKAKEEINHFNIALALETSVQELRHPQPLPKGKFNIKELYASFKHYPHAFQDFGAELTINDTALLLRNFNGKIDSSDLRFSGRVNNYALWFNKVKRGKTVIAFDLKSTRLAMRDLLGRYSREYVPKGYHEEVANNLWLRSKTELKYDSTFRFANIRIANISGELTKHPFRIDSLSGNIKMGADHFVRIDTLRGKIGRSDFDISMRLYTGKDSARKAKENYLQFHSRFLDVDQLSNYKFTDADAPLPDSLLVAQAPVKATTVSNTSHAANFNIFNIPFINFRATVAIDKIKYQRLWIKNLFTNARMQENQQLYLDTLRMDMAEGNIAARAHFNGSNAEKINLRSRITVRDVNLEKMLLKLDYLGQDYVINKNIRGKLTGQIRSYVQLHPDLTPVLEHTEAHLDVDIHDGVLVNFAPMQAMSSYFKDKNLNLVRFDTLRNKLTFKDGALTIPSMNINSSLGFLEISGKQSLNMNMEYFVRIPLKMVTQVGWRMLFGKKQEEVDTDQVDAIEYRDKDKKVRFLNVAISGTPEEYKVKLGKAKKS